MDRHKFIDNPYRPGAGHRPPVLAGRAREQDHFRRLLRQDFCTENILITGLRGFGKTVLLDDLRVMAEEEGWLWVGNDLSESSALSEERLALRILTDLASALSRVLQSSPESKNGRATPGGIPTQDADPDTFQALKAKYESSPGLPSDKLKTVLGRLGSILAKADTRGIVIAYDEAQCLSDHAERDEFPMSMLVETISTLQKNEGVTPCLLVLSGLPQLFDALTSTRTYTERMFHVMQLERLNRLDTATALATPLQDLMPPLHCSEQLLAKTVDLTGGYPYLIQFFGRELVDSMLRNGGFLDVNQFPSADVMDRLDSGLFAARWNKTTDKQRRWLKLIARRNRAQFSDFSAQEILESNEDAEGFDNSQANQMMLALCERGLLYRTRHGRYAFTVPMSEAMILRRIKAEQEVTSSWTLAPPELPPVQAPIPQPQKSDPAQTPPHIVEANVSPQHVNGSSAKKRRRGWFRKRLKTT